MSKSLGNFIDLTVIDAYRAKYSTDALRWYLITQGPLGVTDADFTHAKFVEVYNADLANGIGNCASRVANMVAKYFGGELPDPEGIDTVEEGDIAFLWKTNTPRDIEEATAESIKFNFARVFYLGTKQVMKVDQYINKTSPFKLAKIVGDDASKKTQLAAILYHCAETLRIASLLLYPAMPEKMSELWRRWNCVPPPGVPLVELAKWGGPHSLKPGTRLEIGEALFMRADPAEPAPA